jgi:ubiquinone/menaquinone biosynthesis C-methylase UbiE
LTERYVHGYETEEQQRLLEQAEHWRDELILDGTTLEPGTRLLEVGCGVGAVLGILGQGFPGIELSGVDVEARQLEAAGAHLTALGLSADLRVADALDLPFEDGSFDQVWTMWFLEHLDDPVGALQEARRVLVPGGAMTAIEVDYNSVWATPTNDAFEAMFAAVARTMGGQGWNDAGARVEGWLREAGFASVDPGERKLSYSGAELARQVPYVSAVVEATLADTGDPAFEPGLAALRALPATPGAALGWDVHKAHAVR